MPSSLRRTGLLVALALAVVAAGCGGESGESGDVPEGAIAVVGDREIAKTDFDRLLAQAEKTFKARKQEVPKVGTPEYEQLKNAIVKSLVEQAEFEQGAEELGVEVTDEDVDKRLDELKQQFFNGDQKKYEQELERQGLTEEQVRDDLRRQVLSEKIFEEVTKDVKVTDADVEKYYEEHQADFETPATREVRHILVKSKTKANDLYAQIRGGASFAKLAKQFSQDPASKDQGGKFTAQKGQTVAPFDKTVFELDTGELSKPVKTQFGWHIIEALSAVKAKSTRPLTEVEKDIQNQLLEQKRQDALNKWVDALKEGFEGEVSYAPGFQPPAAATTTEETDETGATETTSE
ncbi:MAG: peptidylprolyl isomerase [Gaiellaceae bacterium]